MKNVTKISLSLILGLWASTALARWECGTGSGTVCDLPYTSSLAGGTSTKAVEANSAASPASADISTEKTPISGTISAAVEPPKGCPEGTAMSCTPTPTGLICECLDAEGVKRLAELVEASLVDSRAAVYVHFKKPTKKNLGERRKHYLRAVKVVDKNWVGLNLGFIRSELTEAEQKSDKPLPTDRWIYIEVGSAKEAEFVAAHMFATSDLEIHIDADSMNRQADLRDVYDMDLPKFLDSEKYSHGGEESYFDVSSKNVWTKRKGSSEYPLRLSGSGRM